MRPSSYLVRRNGGRKTHVIHQTKSSGAEAIVTLCEEAIGPNEVKELSPTARATCAKCLELDRPLSSRYRGKWVNYTGYLAKAGYLSPSMWGEPRALRALLSGDYIQTRVIEIDGMPCKLYTATARGKLLVEALTTYRVYGDTPTRGVDKMGVVHVRNGDEGASRYAWCEIAYEDGRLENGSLLDSKGRPLSTLDVYDLCEENRRMADQTLTCIECMLYETRD